MNIDDQYDPLCCCEYFDHNSERNHILGCCCNCVDFDQVFENFICCRPINKIQKESMLSTMFDRIRIPWRGGAKLITLDCLIPFVLNPLLIYLASNNLTCTIISLLILWVVIMKANKYFSKVTSRGRFHFFWTLSTACYLFAIFETMLPLYEFLPEENLVFVILFCVTLALFYRTKDLSSKQKFTDLGDNSFKNDDTKVLISAVEANSVRARPHRSQNNPYYNCWIDAHLDQTNGIYYVLGLITTIITFAIYSDLTLTAVCHPYLFTSIFHLPISLPDDCSDIYELYDVAIGFIAGLYGVLVCLVAIFYLIKYLILMYFGRRYNTTLRV